MITAQRKPFDEIYGCARRHRKVLVLGCGSCVTVCMAGGETEALTLSYQLELAARERGDSFEVRTHTITRQCDREFFDDHTSHLVMEAGAVVSMACGVGVQYCAERFPEATVYPALDTQFYGATVEPGVWAERCAGCGECILESTGGVCPIARCAKNLLNGPCGGSQDGKCEVNDQQECAWQLIFDRLKAADRLGDFARVKGPKNWSRSISGGPRKIVREDVTLQ
jgi:ferredoxin